MRCFICKAVYDLECINMNTQQFNTFYKKDKKRRDSWKCPECISKRPKSGNQNTPVRPILSPDTSNNVTQRNKSAPKEPSDTSTDSLYGAGDRGVDETSVDPTVELRQFWEEMRAVRNELSLFRTAMSDLTAAINSQNTRLDKLESAVEMLEAKYSAPESSTITHLEETVAQLKLEIEERDQDMLMCDVEIAGYPEDGASPTHAVLTVAKLLAVEVQERDIVSTLRMGAPPPTGEAADGGSVAVHSPSLDAAAARPSRPRPIAVRLARRDLRDALLAAARVRRRLAAPQTADDEPSVSFVYVNERLTRRNRQLFQKTRETAKRLAWKYVWTRDGKIFTRREHRGMRYRIRVEEDLIRVFGEQSVSGADRPF